MFDCPHVLACFLKYIFLLTLIPVICGMGYYSRLNKTAFYVWILVIVSFSIDILSRILIHYGQHTLLTTYFYVLLEFLIITLIFRLEFKSFLSPYLLELLYMLFLVFTCIDILLLQGFSSYNSYQRLIEYVLVLAYVLTYFYKLTKELKIARLEKEPLFLFSTGLLLYFSGSIFIFIFSNYLLSYSLELTDKIWTLHATFHIIFQLFNTIAIGRSIPQ